MNWDDQLKRINEKSKLLDFVSSLGESDKAIIIVERQLGDGKGSMEWHYFGNTSLAEANYFADLFKREILE